MVDNFLNKEKNSHNFQVSQQNYCDIENKHLAFSLEKKEIFLLHYLHHRKIKQGIDLPVKELFKDYNRTISSLKERGYLKDDEHSFFLQEMNISDLKMILKKLSLPTFGKKIDLITRIVENTTSEERATMCSDLYYVLTSKGVEVDNEYIQNRKIQNENLKRTLLQEIKSGNYEQAAIIQANEYAQMPIPPGIGIDWTDLQKIQDSSKYTQNRLRKYDFSDINNSKNYKEILFQILYYDTVIENNLFVSISQFIDSEREKIDCPSIEKFFKEKGYMPTEVEKIFVYLDTKRFNEFQTNMRKTLKNEKYHPLPKGIFHISDQTINSWKRQREDREEFKQLSQLGIKGFPKTLQTFQKHKEKNDAKYHSWLNTNL